MRHNPCPTIIDIEASGFGSRSYPIEIGAIKANGERYFPHEYMYQMIRLPEFAGEYDAAVDPANSWMLAAAERNLPIIVPGWEDTTLGNMYAGHVISGDVKNVHTVRTGIEYMAWLAGWYTKTARKLRNGEGSIGFFQIGGGIAGLSTAWLLAPQRQVTLFEAGSYVGGHTNTIDVTVDGLTHPVDTGFLVFNRRTYPNLCALFALLQVEAVETEMSFGLSLAEPELEWAGSDLGTVFAQRANLVRPAFLGMLRDILRFNRETTRMAREGTMPALSLGDYLAIEGYAQAFRDWYLLPMAAAIWSCPMAGGRRHSSTARSCRIRKRPAGCSHCRFRQGTHRRASLPQTAERRSTRYW